MFGDTFSGINFYKDCFVPSTFTYLITTLQVCLLYALIAFWHITWCYSIIEGRGAAAKPAAPPLSLTHFEAPPLTSILISSVLRWGISFSLIWFMLYSPRVVPLRNPCIVRDPFCKHWIKYWSWQNFFPFLFCCAWLYVHSFCLMRVKL